MNEFINKIAIAELDPNKSYIVEVNTDKFEPKLFTDIRRAFEKIGINNIFLYPKGEITITQIKKEE